MNYTSEFMNTLKRELLNARIEGLREAMAVIEQKIADAEAQIAATGADRIDGLAMPAPGAARTRAKRRAMPEASRQKISEAQKRRWEKIRDATGGSGTQGAS
jgi:hypothetical protein